MSQNILIVDDEKLIADSIAAVLRSSGFTATAYYDAAAALAVTESECPDLVISDISMPQIDGISLARRLRERWPACRILLLSGYGQGETADFEVAAKPVSVRELIRRAESACLCKS